MSNKAYISVLAMFTVITIISVVYYGVAGNAEEVSYRIAALFIELLLIYDYFYTNRRR